MIIEHSIGVDTGRRYPVGFYSSWLLSVAITTQNLTMSAAASVEVSAPVATIANAFAQSLISPTIRINVTVPVGSVDAGQDLTMAAAASIEVSVPAATIGLQAPFTPTPISGQGKYPGNIEGTGKYV